MKAMVVKEFGGSDAFVLDDIPKPEVSAGNVLVKIVATSVNTVDMMIREMVLAFLSPLQLLPF